MSTLGRYIRLVMWCDHLVHTCTSQPVRSPSATGFATPSDPAPIRARGACRRRLNHDDTPISISSRSPSPAPVARVQLSTRYRAYIELPLLSSAQKQMYRPIAHLSVHGDRKESNDGEDEEAEARKTRPSPSKRVRVRVLPTVSDYERAGTSRIPPEIKDVGSGGAVIMQRKASPTIVPSSVTPPTSPAQLVPVPSPSPLLPASPIASHLYDLAAATGHANELATGPSHDPPSKRRREWASERVAKRRSSEPCEGLPKPKEHKWEAHQQPSFSTHPRQCPPVSPAHLSMLQVAAPPTSAQPASRSKELSPLVRPLTSLQANSPTLIPRPPLVSSSSCARVSRAAARGEEEWAHYESQAEPRLEACSSWIVAGKGRTRAAAEIDHRAYAMEVGFRKASGTTLSKPSKRRVASTVDGGGRTIMMHAAHKIKKSLITVPSCHHCRTRNYYEKMRCSAFRNSKQCGAHYCQKCIRLRYGITKSTLSASAHEGTQLSRHHL